MFNIPKYISENTVLLSARLGVDLPPELGEPTPCIEDSVNTDHICWAWGEAAQFQVDKRNADDDDTCYDITWQNREYIPFRGEASLRSMTDCFLLEDDTHWFVGPEEYYQHFPMR